jgi:hypothetical protein
MPPWSSREGTVSSPARQRQQCRGPTATSVDGVDAAVVAAAASSAQQRAIRRSHSARIAASSGLRLAASAARAATAAAWAWKRAAEEETCRALPSRKDRPTAARRTGCAMAARTWAGSG